MNCDQCVDVLVDFARGGRPDGVEPARAHLARCPSCSQRFSDQLHLTACLRALADATAASAPSEALERRLMTLFDEQVAARGPARTTAAALRAWWLPAAAVLLLATAGTAAWMHLRTHTVPIRHAAGSPGMVRPAPEVRAAPPVNEEAPPPGPTPRSHGDGARRAAVAPRAVVARGFVPLPWAAGLPDFDRGEIVRVDIPLTALPLYGIDIPADAEDRLVRADMLVGQDGQPRAIRLVAPNPTEQR